MEYLITLACEYNGHEKTIRATLLDEVLLKSIKLECPLKMAPLIKMHKRFLYFPRGEILKKMINFYYKKNDYQSFKQMAISCFQNE